MSTKLKVLVVEDSPANIEAAKKQLADYDLTVVSSYDEANLEHLLPYLVILIQHIARYFRIL